MEPSRESDQPYQEISRETQKEPTDKELRRLVMELAEKYREDSTEYVRRLAELLDYDDKCGGEAVRAHREEFRVLADQIVYLEHYGFTARVRPDFREENVSITVEFTRPDNTDKTLVLYRQSFLPHPEGFPRQAHERQVIEMYDKVTTAAGVAGMFGVKPRESTSA